MRPPWCPQRLETTDVAVSRIKFERQLVDWRSNEDVYRTRGWLLAAHGDRWAEVLFFSDSHPRMVYVCIGLDYVNFDVEPPSLTFIDPVTRTPMPPFSVPMQLDDTGQPVTLLVNHPELGRPFLCLPGTWEYHTHPQHDGDPWLGPHRALSEGHLAVIADRLWQACVRHRPLLVQMQPQIVAVFDAEGWRAEGGPPPTPAVVDGEG